jgi:hypothetical protein
MTQEIGMRPPNPFRLDQSHSQIIQTTGRTAPSTLQAFGMDLRQCGCLVVDLSVEIAEITKKISEGGRIRLA